MKNSIQTNSLIFPSCESYLIYHTVSIFSECGHSNQKGRFCIAAKTSFFVVSIEKTPIFLRTCQPLLLLLPIQQRLRLHQPSGCCPLQRCNSMYFPVSLKAYENQRISAVFPVFPTLLHLFSILLVSD